MKKLNYSNLFSNKYTVQIIATLMQMHFFLFFLYNPKKQTNYREK